MYFFINAFINLVAICYLQINKKNSTITSI
jgi:hypothetical protein